MSGMLAFPLSWIKDGESSFPHLFKVKFKVKRRARYVLVSLQEVGWRVPFW